MVVGPPDLPASSGLKWRVGPKVAEQVTTMMDENRVGEIRQKLREPVEIRAGEFKPLGECTTDDLRAAAQLSDQRPDNVPSSRQ